MWKQSVFNPAVGFPSSAQSVLVGLLWDDLNMPDVAAGCVLLSFALWLQWRLMQALAALPGRKGGRVWLNLESFVSEREKKKEKHGNKQKWDETFMILCRKIRSLQQLIVTGNKASTLKCNLNTNLASLGFYKHIKHIISALESVEHNKWKIL